MTYNDQTEDQALLKGYWLGEIQSVHQAKAAAEPTQEWVRSDGVGAAAWFAGVVEPQPYGYFESLVRRAIVDRPQQMALEFSDETRRTKLLKEVLKKWQSSDPLGAETFMPELGATERSAPSAH